MLGPIIGKIWQELKESRGAESRAYVIAEKTSGRYRDNLNLVASEILPNGAPYYTGSAGTMKVAIFRGFRVDDGPWDVFMDLPMMSLQQVQSLGDALEALKIRMKKEEFDAFCQGPAQKLITKKLAEMGITLDPKTSGAHPEPTNT